jgi:hypothetical protein
MRIRGHAAALLVLSGTGQAAAQRIIYDGGRDTTATQAATAAKEITSGALFDTMLRNVDAQAKVEADTTLAYLREQMRAKLIALEVWQSPGIDPPVPKTPNFIANARGCPRSVDCFLRQMREKHREALKSANGTDAEVKAKLEVVKKKLVELDAALKALQSSPAKSKDARVDHVFDLLEEHGKTVLAFAEKVAGQVGEEGRLKGASKALDQIGAGLDQVIKMYRITSDIWTSRGLVDVKPSSLRPPPEETELQLLRVEQEHLATIARIEAKRQLDVGEALVQVEAAIDLVVQAGVSVSSNPIEVTLRAASGDRAALLKQQRALHAVAAVTAQMDAADRLATVRLADQARRFSIRQSAIHSTTYEVAIRAAADRLSAYWKRGLKASEVAEFAAWIANTAALVEVSRKE